MKYLLDIDRVIALAKKSVAMMQRLRKFPPPRVRASSIIMGELHFGAAKSRYPDIAVANMRLILKTRVVVPFDDVTAESYIMISCT